MRSHACALEYILQLLVGRILVNFCDYPLLPLKDTEMMTLVRHAQGAQDYCAILQSWPGSEEGFDLVGVLAPGTVKKVVLRSRAHKSLPYWTVNCE